MRIFSQLMSKHLRIRWTQPPRYTPRLYSSSQVCGACCEAPEICSGDFTQHDAHTKIKSIYVSGP